MNSLNFQENKLKNKYFFNTLKHAQHKTTCICIVNQIYERDDTKKLTVLLTKLKDEKLKIKSEIVEKYKISNEYFEQDYFSKTAKSYQTIRHETIRIKKWMENSDKHFETMIVFDLMPSVSKYLIDSSLW